MDFLLVLSRSIPRRGERGGNLRLGICSLPFFCSATSAGTLHSLSPHIVMRLSSPRLYSRSCSKQGFSAVGYSTCTYCCIWIGWRLGLGKRERRRCCTFFTPTCTSTRNVPKPLCWCNYHQFRFFWVCVCGGGVVPKLSKKKVLHGKSNYLV